MLSAGVPPLQLLNNLMKCDANGGYHEAVLFNLLQAVMSTWQMCKLVRQG